MELKPSLKAAFEALGATPGEIASLTDYYADQITERASAVAAIEANIASLQVQLVEETQRNNKLRARIGKFVVALP